MAADERPRKSGASSQDEADELRRHAEELLDELEVTDSPVPDDVAAVVHELRVHQIELEMQNEELRTAQLALDDQRAKYYDLFDLAPVGYVTLNGKGIVADANLTAVHLLGLERQLLTGQPFAAYVHAEDRDDFYLRQREVEKTGEPQSYEIRLRRAAPGDSDNGAPVYFWAHLEGKPQSSDEGETLFWITIADITELVEDREALRQSESRFVSLFEQAPLGYQSLDEDGHFLAVNEMWLETLGYTREEVIGTWFGDFLAPEFVDGFRERFPMFKARGAIHSEFEMMHKDGSRRIIAFEGRIGHNPDGTFQKTHCILSDITERKRAETALTESEEKYRFLFERSAVAQSMTSLTGELAVNPAFCEMLGFAQAELADSTTWMSLTHPDDVADNRRLLEAILAGEQDSARFEKRYLHKDGQVVWVDVSTSLRRDAGGEPLYFVTTMLDITERKQTQDALIESEDKFKFLWVNSVVGKSLTLPTGEVDVNCAFCKMLGYTPLELADKNTWAQLTHPDDIASTQLQVDALLSGERESARFEKRFIHKDGQIVWADLSTSLRRDANGEPMYFMTSIVDITERKHAEEALSESEQRYRAIVGASPAPMALNDEQLNITFLNPAFTKSYGYTLADIPTLADWWPKAYPDPEYRQWVSETWDARLAQAKRTGEPFKPVELTVQCGDATQKTVLASAASIVGAYEGEHLVVLYDITDRKLAEQALALQKVELELSNTELTRLNTQKNQFLGMAAHDLRNPVNIVLNYADLLDADTDPVLAPEHRAYVDTISHTATRMARLIDSFLDVSLIDSGHFILDREVISIPRLMQSACLSVEPVALGRAVSINTVIERGLPHRLGDESKLEQVLINLLTNAIQASPPGASVTVGCRMEGQDLFFSVTDVGTGMDAQAREQLFQAFESPHRRKSDGSRSIGLGLLIAEKIITAHGGHLEVESEPGRGSTFGFTIPANPTDIADQGA